MPRILSDEFEQNLVRGSMKSIVIECKADHTLCFEIRNDAFNIYYRGGSLLQVKRSIYRKKETRYEAKYDAKYLKIARDDTHRQQKRSLAALLRDLPKEICDDEGARAWIAAFPRLKYGMDLWFGRHQKTERELQQEMVRENNRMPAASATDYFIVDVEYAWTVGKNRLRMDMIAVKWLSNAAARKSGRNLRLAFIEMKYAEGALTGKAGLHKHISDIRAFLDDDLRLDAVKREIAGLVNQKRRLGLLHTSREITEFSTEKPEYIFVFANHDPEASVLGRELRRLPDCPEAEVKVMRANFAGFGLHDESILDVRTFLRQFSRQISKKE